MIGDGKRQTAGNGTQLKALAAACAFAFVTVGAGSCAAGGGTGAGSTISGKTLTIYSSVPHRGPRAADGRAIENGAAIALDQVGRKVGKYTIDWFRYGDSLASGPDPGEAAQNAEIATSRGSAVGYIGDIDAPTTEASMPILNDDGIAQVAPSVGYVGLTSTAPGTLAGEPAKYASKSLRTFVRLAPNDQRAATALAAAAAQLHCGSLQVWSANSKYANGLAATAAAAARRYRVRVTGQGAAGSAVHADCLAYAGDIDAAGLNALAKAGSAKLLAGGALCLDAAVVPKPLASRLTCVLPAFDEKSLGAPAAGFFARYRSRYGAATPPPLAVYGYESMALLLDSIRRAEAAHGGSVSQTAVVNALFDTRDRRSALGTYSIAPSGDSSLDAFGLYRISAGKLVPVRRVQAPAAGG